MIKSGQCKCLWADCNSEPAFPADEALYRFSSSENDREKAIDEAIENNDAVENDPLAILDVEDYQSKEEFDDFLRSQAENNPDSVAGRFFSAIEELEERPAAENKTFHSDKPTDGTVYVSLAELTRSVNNEVVKKDDAGNTVKIRLLPNRCVGKLVIDGHTFYQEAAFAIAVNNGEERIVKRRADKRFCPKCKHELAADMGFKDYLFILILGNTNSGKTTWLHSTYKRRNDRISGWTLELLNDKDFKDSIVNLAAEKYGLVDTTKVDTPQERLIYHHSIAKSGKRIGLIFRDIAGESIDSANQKASAVEHAEKAQQFASFSDGILIFRDVTSMHAMHEMYNNVPDGYTLSLEDYQNGIKEALDRINDVYKTNIGSSDAAETSYTVNGPVNAFASPNTPASHAGDSMESSEKAAFSYYDISSALMYLNLPRDRKLAVMYVMNKVDLLKELINKPLLSPGNDPDEEDLGISAEDQDGRSLRGMYPFDFRCTSGSAQHVLAHDSPIFEPVSHALSFNTADYLRNAVATAHFANETDPTVFNRIFGMINDNGFNGGAAAITGITKNRDTIEAVDGKRAMEPLAWLIETLVNGRDFTDSLVAQYAKHLR